MDAPNFNFCSKLHFCIFFFLIPSPQQLQRSQNSSTNPTIPSQFYKSFSLILYRKESRGVEQRIYISKMEFTFEKSEIINLYQFHISKLHFFRERKWVSVGSTREVLSVFYSSLPLMTSRIYTQELLSIYHRPENCKHNTALS